MSRSTQARRYLALFLVGLLVGAIATTMALRAIEARQDHFDQAVMRVQQWHVNELAANIESNRCAATDTLPHLRTLRALADDLEPAFPDLRDDARYMQHASSMRAAVDNALASPPMNCPGLSATVQNVREACKACHQDFRGS
ncbi:cytochrome c [Cognatilysobacter bugurensis]|nr:cytochrome c [Lysobacter bugurensis]